MLFRSLGLQQDAVALAIQAIERYKKSPTNGVTSLEYIDRRIAFAIPVRVNFYNYDISAYEQVLSDLKRALSENDVPQLHQRNVGTSIRCEDFLQGRFIASEIFVFVNSNLNGRASYLRELDSRDARNRMAVSSSPSLPKRSRGIMARKAEPVSSSSRTSVVSSE